MGKLSNFPNGVSSFGIPIMGGGGVPAMFGDVFFVDYRNGIDGNDGKSKDRAFKTLSQAYAKVTSNHNDLILIDGDSGVAEDAMITWAKNRVHVVGLGGGFISGQRSRITQSATGKAADSAANITVSGTGNTFSNLKIQNEGTHASSVAALIDAGEANVYSNCSFLKTSDLGEAAVSDVLARGDTSTFVDCEFGFDTLIQTAARATFRITNSGATICKHLMMRNCHFTCASSESTKSFILVTNSSSISFSNTFVDCTFNNALLSTGSAAALADAVTSGASLLNGNLLFVNPAANTTEFCSAVTDQVTVVGPVSSAQTGEGVTPS